MTTHNVTLRLNEKAKVSYAPVAADGQPAQIDNPFTPITFVSSNASVADVVNQNNTFYVFPASAGSCSIVATVKSAGVNVSEQINVTVNDATAVSLGIVISPPQPK